MGPKTLALDRRFLRRNRPLHARVRNICARQALVAAPLSPGEAPPTQLAPTGPPPHPLEKIQKAAERALMDEQKILEGQHSLSQGLLVVSSSILVALHESIPEICARIKDRFAENPKEGVTLLRDLMEISEKVSKTHGRNVETQRAIAGVPSSHELIVRREGSQGPDPDAEEQRIEDNRLLKNLIKAEARWRLLVRGRAVHRGRGSRPPRKRALRRA